MEFRAHDAYMDVIEHHSIRAVGTISERLVRYNAAHRAKANSNIIAPASDATRMHGAWAGSDEAVGVGACSSGLVERGWYYGAVSCIGQCVDRRFGRSSAWSLGASAASAMAR